MNRSAIAMATIIGCLGLTTLVEARPPDDRHEEKRDVRPERKDEHREQIDERLRKPEAPAVAPAAQTNSDRYREHFLQAQQQARQRRKQVLSNAKAWNDSRVQRAASHRTDISQTWGNATDRPDARAELALHADRMARLNRALDLAEEKGDTALANQTNDLVNREIARDANVMASIQAKAGTP